jgi:hypothetical protein
LVIEKLKIAKYPGNDQITVVLTGTIRCEIRKLFISIWNKEELPEDWNGSIMLPIYKKVIKQTVVIV